MSKSSRAEANGSNTSKRRSATGPIAFFVSLFIVALGSIQLVSTFHTYALNLAELNGLKREEASLIAKKQDLENDIKRWNDKAYVTAQARERLGFVFPDEQAVRVLHPEAVTGTESQSDSDSDSQTGNSKVLPWYSELSYSFKKADEPVSNSKSAKSDSAEQSKTSKQSNSSTNTTDSQHADQNSAGEGTQQ
ncbi:FtsB family cell division protein [Bifidobacterium colobi]|nr:septum formation initiator family protein [Bifidobacterium colobi]